MYAYLYLVYAVLSWSLNLGTENIIRGGGGEIIGKKGIWLGVRGI